jgi:hypothetical protein
MEARMAASSTPDAEAAARPAGYVSGKYSFRVFMLMLVSFFLLPGSIYVRQRAGEIGQSAMWQSIVHRFRRRQNAPFQSFSAGSSPLVPYIPPQQAAHLMALQNACMQARIPPPDQIAYEEDPAEAARIALSGDYSSETLHEYGTSHVGGQTPCDGAEYLAMIPGTLWHEPVALKQSEEWKEFYGTEGRIYWGSPKPGNTIFMHELVSTGGHHRLVHVGVERQGELTMEPFPLWPGPRTYRIRSRTSLAIAVASVAGPQSVPDLTWTGEIDIERPFSEDVIQWTKGRTWDEGKVELKTGDHLRLYAGQLDAADPSHFTVDYELPRGRRGKVNFFLLDDDDVVMLPRAVLPTVRPSGNNDPVWRITVP